MRISYTSHFARAARRVPVPLRGLVEERIGRFQNDPHDPSLRTHKLSGKLAGLWSFAIDRRLRIIFEYVPGGVLFHSIGDHSIYDI